VATLTNLGLSSAGLVPLQRQTQEPKWITERAFVPEVGGSYEVSFGKIHYRGREGHVTAKLRINGLAPSDWFDIDEGAPLDSALAQCVVQAFRAIDVA
jgi:hypothetical protein